MRNLKARIVMTKDEMTKTDIVETFLLILNKIVEYTSDLTQITPTIFDNKYTPKEKDDETSTCVSSYEENANNSLIEEEEEKEKDKFTLSDSLYYWVEKLQFDENLIILTIMTIDKLLAKNFIVTADNVKKVLFTAMVITQKNYEDEIYNDKDYCKLIGVTANELIEMQIEFLTTIDFCLFISDESLEAYKLKVRH